MRKRRPKGICPVCGQPYNWIETRTEGDQKYYYAVHYYGIKNGKKQIKKCYLGPSNYIYVSMTNPIVLQGRIADLDQEMSRVVTYLEDLLDRVETNAHTIPAPNLASLSQRLKKIAEKLDRLSRRA